MSFQEFKAKDVRVGQDNDLVVENGDFVSELSDDRHVKMIIRSAKGNYRFAPYLGVDIFAFLNSTGQADVLTREIQDNLQLDGYAVNSIDYGTDGKKINVKAKRIR
jgi:hypothetical protein